MEETLQVHPPACDRVTGVQECTPITPLPGPRPAAGGSRPFPLPSPRASRVQGKGPPPPRLPLSRESWGLAGSISGGPEVRWEAEPSPKGASLPRGGAVLRKRARPGSARFLGAAAVTRLRARGVGAGAALRPGPSATSLARPPCPPPTMRPLPAAAALTMLVLAAARPGCEPAWDPEGKGTAPTLG